MRKFISLILIFLFGCSTTYIKSMPSGAKLYMDGEYKGITPYKYTDAKISGSWTKIVIKKEGYKNFETTLKRNDEMHVTALVFGILVLVPLLWCREYADEYVYELEKEDFKK